MILTPMEAVIGAAMNALSRRFEWQADQFACELSEKLGEKDMEDMGTRLGKALTTLHVKNLSTVWVDWLYVLAIIRPCERVVTKIFLLYRFSAYHHSHPTLLERLRAIEAFEVKKAKGKDVEVKKEL